MKKQIIVLAFITAVLLVVGCIAPTIAFAEEVAETPETEQPPEESLLEALKGKLTEEQITALQELLDIVKNETADTEQNVFTRIWEWVKKNYTVVIAVGLLLYETIRGFVDRKSRGLQSKLLTTNNNIVKATNANTTANADLINSIETQSKSLTTTGAEAQTAKLYAEKAFEMVYLLLKNSNAPNGTKDIADQLKAELMAQTVKVGDCVEKS